MSVENYLAEEILLIASAVLCLVLLLGGLIVCSLSFHRPPIPGRLTVQKRLPVSKGGWVPAPAAGPYNNDSVFDGARRRTTVLAQELKKELAMLRHKLARPESISNTQAANPNAMTSL
ncbi:hypothetical protein CDD83_8427 [Cordyceps sp. RAO-2017]|nr:hypothetical protein CDD83_8427 [Cordyceps sp. RAO-2017]